ncbi:MAG: hypothetical protein ABEJ87_06010 [Candidatus Nanohalobium sp.]
MTLQEYEVKRIEPFSFGKISAALTALMGLISGLMYLPFAFVVMMGSLEISTAAAAIAATIVSVLMIIFISVVYAGVGFFLGVLYGYVYNYASSKIGGLEMIMDVEG